MHYINIANGYLIRRLQVWKAKHWRNWIYWAFPNHFAQGPWPCHMLGGCRSSLETSVQHDGWHARADTLGHLIFLSEFFGRTILVEIHPFKKQKNPHNCNTNVGLAFEKCCSPVKAWIREKGEVLLKEMLHHSLFSVVIFWKDLQMGGRETWM